MKNEVKIDDDNFRFKFSRHREIPVFTFLETLHNRGVLRLNERVSVADSGKVFTLIEIITHYNRLAQLNQLVDIRFCAIFELCLLGGALHPYYVHIK